MPPEPSAASYPFVSPDRPDGEAPHFVAEMFFLTQVRFGVLHVKFACGVSHLVCVWHEAAMDCRGRACGGCGAPGVQRERPCLAGLAHQQTPKRPQAPQPTCPLSLPPLQRLVHTGLVPAM